MGIFKVLTYITGLLLCILLITGKLQAQQPTTPAADSTFRYRSDTAFLNRLVELAIENYPAYKVYDSRIKQSDEALHRAKWSWLNNLNLIYQLNSFTDPSTGTGSTVVPRFGLGVGINVGSIVMVPSNTRSAREEITIQELNKATYELQLKTEITQRYRTLLLHLDLMAVQTQAVNDAESTMQWIEEKFKRGEVTIDEYNKSLRSLTDNRERQTTTYHNIISAKMAVEELTGIPIEEVQTP